jgi:hypothetical protein
LYLCLISAIGFVLLSVVLFVRTTGIHIDENNYLALAVRSWDGDSAGSGKPVLFYWMNNKLHNEIARSFGPFEPVTIYFFYMAAFAASLAWVLQPIFRERRGTHALAFLVLLASPLALLNATQVMMETALLTAVALLFGAVMRDADRHWKRVRLFIFSAFVIALKVTGISAVVLLAAVVFRRSKRSAAVLMAGALAGYLGDKAALRWVVKSEHANNYGGLSEILNSQGVWERLGHVKEDLYLWLFFQGLVALVAGLIWAAGRYGSKGGKTLKDARIADGALLTLAVGSLLFTLGMQSISIYGFARYNYPVLWLGLISSIVLIARHRSIVLVPLAGLFLFQSSALWGRDLNRFDLWPSRTVIELMESGGTILMGAPIHRLIVEQRLRNPEPCYSLEIADEEVHGFYLQYFNFAFPAGHVADSSQSCVPNFRVWRDRVDAVGSCPVRCDKSYDWTGCGYQRLRFFTPREGLVRNQFCW